MHQRPDIVRDSVEIDEMGFPVFSVGTNPNGQGHTAAKWLDAALRKAGGREEGEKL